MSHQQEYEDTALIGRLGQALKRRAWFACTAESCTGGMAGALFTRFAGSSDFFAGGLITYTNRLKTRLLGVPESILNRYGAVSEPVVLRMCLGALQACETQCAVSYSGIAGPDGGSPAKPVGTVCIAAAMPLEHGTAAFLPSSGAHAVSASPEQKLPDDLYPFNGTLPPALTALTTDGWRFRQADGVLLACGTPHFSGDREAVRAASARSGLLLLTTMLEVFHRS